MHYDYVIIGGGVVGLSVAYGLTRLHKRVTVVDGGDLGLRASRGNFGLVWVQSKGLDAPHYNIWSQRSAALWADHAAELAGGAQDGLGLRQDGGYDIFLDEESLAAKAAEHEKLREALGGEHEFEIMGHNALRREEPNIGPRVAGAIYGPKDGHVNPLRLLRTLAQGNIERGTELNTGTHVHTVTELPGGGFRIEADTGTWEAAKVVLCAGLGASELGPQLGFMADSRPQRGQVMITEKLPTLLNRPAGALRQVDEGGIQIGVSNENIGYDDRTTADVTAAMARRAVEVLPALAGARVVRTWAALRVMSPDGKPVYQQSKTCPGAYLVTCHSGVTLSAAHARLLPLWLENHPDAPDLEAFSEDRFALSPAA